MKTNRRAATLGQRLAEAMPKPRPVVHLKIRKAKPTIFDKITRASRIERYGKAGLDGLKRWMYRPTEKTVEHHESQKFGSATKHHLFERETGMARNPRLLNVPGENRAEKKAFLRENRNNQA